MAFYKIIPLLMLSACVAKSECPPARYWSREEQSQMAKEIAQLPPDNILIDVMQDYSYTRNKLKACHGN